MHLSQFLKAQQIGLSDFAIQLGIKVSTLHGYVSGRRRPSIEIAVRIEDATGGAVQARDFLHSTPPAHAEDLTDSQTGSERADAQVGKAA